MKKQKIVLSPKEQALVCNTEWILTKHIIIQKVYDLFGELVLPMQRLVMAETHHLPKEINKYSPKISKGENYLGLPYVILDYPRFFEKENTIAVRTMFWWGNFFSITLQLSGTFKKRFATAITGHYGFLQQNDYWICIAADPWQHHFNEDNYIRVKNCDETQLAAMLAREPFIKLAKKISLQQWEDATIFLEKSFEEITQILKSKLHR